ncbi:MAG: hypothetical protein E5X66_15230 [Mesorhizobium sp.]|nr:MAG: hypothetical protein E5X66_15230 [Mesorhizobium sp.]
MTLKAPRLLQCHHRRRILAAPDGVAFPLTIRGLPPAERLAARRRRTRPLVRALRRQLMRQGKGLSRHADIAKAFAYGTKRWRAFNRFL